jgi:diaminopimelate decarboxylase
MPNMQAGDLVVILDSGMYSESASSQFNRIPRPATVLVNGSSAAIIMLKEY